MNASIIRAALCETRRRGTPLALLGFPFSFRLGQYVKCLAWVCAWTWLHHGRASARAHVLVSL